MLGVTVDTEKNNGLVLAVKDGSPAKQAGVQPGDIVTEFDGQQVLTSRHLIEMVKQKRIGQVCSIKVQRNGLELSLSITMRVLD